MDAHAAATEPSAIAPDASTVSGVAILALITGLVGAGLTAFGSGMFSERSDTYVPRSDLVSPEPSRPIVAEVVRSLDISAPVMGGGAVLVALALISLGWCWRRGRTPGWTVVFGGVIAATSAVGVVAALRWSEATISYWVSGRPVRRHGRAVIPRCGLVAGGPVSAAALAWTRAAAEEKSAATCFRHLAGRLEAVGAPPPLVDRCRRAARDERRHTEICLAITRSFGATPWLGELAPPPPLRVRKGRARRREIERLVIESIVDGVVGEGFAARRLEIAAAQVDDDLLARRLRQMALDERAHADLAADIIDWCRSEEEGTTDRTCAAVLAGLPPRPSDPPHLAGMPPDARRTAGLADAGQSATAWNEVRREACGT